MAWDEWEQVKAAAAERQNAHMRLNQLPADQGSSSTGGSFGPPAGELRSDKAAWSKAGQGVGDLGDNVGKALTKLEDGQTGLSKASGCLTATAQHGVHSSWKRRVKDIGALCDGLAGVLEKTGNDQLRTDEAVKAQIARLAGDAAPEHGGR
ncbi:hypothetical protein ABZV65_14285 [Streptomyces bauhiniae]|uniref:hypothetical protein n=1 Tax=Streptomyces bauhiniae TaxID=2340725 RepID=UPI0033B82215